MHLHFGLELVFDESQKECNSEIWIDVYDIVRLLSQHRSSIVKMAEGWKRLYPYRDLDTMDYPYKIVTNVCRKKSKKEIRNEFISKSDGLL